MSEQEPGAHQERQPIEQERLAITARRFGERIATNIAAALTEHREIDEGAARMIAHVLGRAFGRESHLAEFGRTGNGTYEELREEYLALYTDNSVPEPLLEWIDWLGTYLVQRENFGSGRHFMNEHLPPKLSQLLVRTSVEVGGATYTVQVPASYGEAALDDLAVKLGRLDLTNDNALQAFLSLPDVNAFSENVTESYVQSFVGSFETVEDALRALSPLEDWEVELGNWAADRGLSENAVQIDTSEVMAQMNENYDIVPWKGLLYAFSK